MGENLNLIALLQDGEKIMINGKLFEKSKRKPKYNEPSKSFTYYLRNGYEEWEVFLWAKFDDGQLIVKNPFRRRFAYEDGWLVRAGKKFEPQGERIESVELIDFEEI